MTVAGERAVFHERAPSALGVSPIDTDTELLTAHGRQLAYLLVRSSRRRLLARFLDAARAHLTDDGSVLILLHERELRLLDGWRAVILETDREFRLVHLT